MDDIDWDQVFSMAEEMRSQPMPPDVRDKIRKREWYVRNRDRALERNRERYREHRDEILARNGRRTAVRRGTSRTGRRVRNTMRTLNTGNASWRRSVNGVGACRRKSVKGLTPGAVSMRWRIRSGVGLRCVGIASVIPRRWSVVGRGRVSVVSGCGRTIRRRIAPIWIGRTRTLGNAGKQKRPLRRPERIRHE